MKDPQFERFFKENQKLWDKRTPHHLQSDFYDMERFLAGGSSLTPIETEALASEVKDKTMLHLQCHFGQDTLSWARMGARVTGMDFSKEAIATARQLNEQLSLQARFIECNVYDLPDHLDEQFDIVFTSYGAICWLPDLQGWARIVAQYLKRGGLFYVAEFHPVLYMYDWDSKALKYPYFQDHRPNEEIVTGTYTDRDASIENLEYSWNHALSRVLQALLDEGLSLLEFKEFGWSPFNCFPNMQQVSPGRYVFGNWPHPIPHIFSYKMRF